jgi:probable HAF family extracellular repeat protein
MSWSQYATRVSLLSLALLVATARAAPLYILEDLGPAVGVSVNTSGVVAGYMLPPDSPQQQAVRLQAGSGPQPLGFLVLNGWISIADGINDSGTIVGISGTDTQGMLPVRAFFWTAGQGMQPLPSLAGMSTFAQANGINSVGTIVGTTDGVPVVWIGQQPSALPTLGGATGGAQAINDLGDIVGQSTGAGSPALRATLWPLEGGVVDLHTLPSTASSFANALTSDRRIVGQIGVRGFLWTDATGMQLLPLLPDDTTSTARGINEAGIIVGSGQVPPAFFGDEHVHATRWVGGVPEDLNALVDAPDWTLHTATDINETGQIVGFGDLDGEQHTFLLTPIPLTFVETVVGDFDGDGAQDSAGLAVNGRVWRCLAHTACTLLPGWLAHLVAGDFTRDGRTDLAGIGGSQTIWVWTEHDQHWREVPGRLVALAARDFNGDGYTDLAGLGADFSLWLTEDLWHWRLAPGNLSALIAGDFDGDGAQDLAGTGMDGGLYFNGALHGWRAIAGVLRSLTVEPGRPDVMAGEGLDGAYWRAPTLGAWQRAGQ